MNVVATRVSLALLVIVVSSVADLFACGAGCGCMGNLAPEIKAKVDAAKVTHGCPGSCMCDVGKNQPAGNAITAPKV